MNFWIQVFMSIAILFKLDQLLGYFISCLVISFKSILGIDQKSMVGRTSKRLY